MQYKSVIVTRRGSPEVLKVVENELRTPADGEVRVKILADCVCRPDIISRYGEGPYPPKTPFTPGYAIVGDVDTTGASVTGYAVGERVSALTVFGGYAEYIYVKQERLIPTPAHLDPAEVSTLILNYITAYQPLHRSAKVKAGDKALVIGASGGVGTALLQLGKLAGLTMYGTASPSKHPALIEIGAIPIDYRTQDFVQALRQAEPEGIDFVFDGMSGDYIKRGWAVLRRGGTLVSFGAPASFADLGSVLAKFVLYNLLPNGKTFKLYGTSFYTFDKHPFLEDWATLLKLLETGQIKPIIARKFPILEAAKANELLESGQVIGNVVLVAPELL